MCVDGRWVAVCKNNEGDMVWLVGTACSTLGFSKAGLLAHINTNHKNVMYAITMNATDSPYSGVPTRTHVCFNNNCTVSSCYGSTDLTVGCLTHSHLITNECEFNIINIYWHHYEHFYAVLCSGSQGYFRLTSSSFSNEGRVEVCMNGGWKSVCGNDQYDEALLEGVCSELGFSQGNL